MHPWGAGEPVVASHAMAAPIALTRELTSILAGSGAPADTLLASAAGIIGYLLNLTELVLTRQIDRAAAAEVATRFILGGLEGLGGPATSSPVDRVD